MMKFGQKSLSWRETGREDDDDEEEKNFAASFFYQSEEKKKSFLGQAEKNFQLVLTNQKSFPAFLWQ